MYMVCKCIWQSLTLPMYKCKCKKYIKRKALKCNELGSVTVTWFYMVCIFLFTSHNIGSNLELKNIFNIFNI